MPVQQFFPPLQLQQQQQPLQYSQQPGQQPYSSYPAVAEIGGQQPQYYQGHMMQAPLRKDDEPLISFD
jgi:hypothetical protein